MLSITAVAYRAEDGTVYSLPRPKRHHHVLRYVHTLGVNPRTGEQGFLTDKGDFARRVEAKVIATEAGQMLDRASKSLECFSEDLW